MANVSKSTVSRVLNKSNNVSEASKIRVEKAIKDLNFEPNKMARALTSGYDAILVVSRPTYSTVGNPFFTEIIQPITKIAEQENFDLILQSSKNDQRTLEKCLSKIKEKAVKGIILLASPSTNDEEYYAKLDETGIPIVVIGKLKWNYKNIFSVDTDNFAISYAMIQHLIGNGHTKIACIHPPLSYHSAIDRLEGYKKCLGDNNIPINDEWITDCGYSSEETIECVKKLLTSSNRPTAIFTTDELKVLTIYNVAASIGLSIPEDISVVGISSSYITKLLSPSLSVFQLPVVELGEVATKLLFEKIKNKEHIDNQIINSYLSLGKSVQKIK